MKIDRTVVRSFALFDRMSDEDLDRLLAVAGMHKEFIPHALDSSLLRAGRGNVLLPAPERQQKVAS